METIRQWFQGKKVYLTALAGVVTAIIAWASESISLMELLGALWAAITACFMRAGITTEAHKAVEAIEEEAKE